MAPGDEHRILEEARSIARRHPGFRIVSVSAPEGEPTGWGVAFSGPSGVSPESPEARVVIAELERIPSVVRVWLELT